MTNDNATTEAPVSPFTSMQLHLTDGAQQTRPRVVALPGRRHVITWREPYRSGTIIHVLWEYWERNAAEELSSEDARLKAEAALATPVSTKATRKMLCRMVQDAYLCFDPATKLFGRA